MLRTTLAPASRCALVTASLVAALLVLPGQASAAEGFVGVTERGSLVRFTTQAPYSLTTPKRPRGLAPGERIVALGRAARGVVAVGSSARLYALDPESGRATAIGPSFPQGLRGSRFSLAVAENGDRGRLLSDVGQDLVVDMTTGVTSDGPGLRRERDGAPVRPAADLTPDGAVVGVQINPPVLLHELARGTTTMAERPLETPEGFGLGEPLAFQLGSDGKGYVIGVAADRQRDRQSVFLRIDPTTGRYAPPTALAFQAFGRRITTFADLGRVPDDHKAPKLHVTVPRRISLRALFDHRVALKVRSNEAGQITMSVRVNGKSAGFGFATRDTPGVFDVTNFGAVGKERGRLRSAVGRHVRVSIGASDLKRNHVRVVRTVRLTR